MRPTHPPRLTTRPVGSLERRAECTWAPATRVPPEPADPTKTPIHARSKAATERRATLPPRRPPSPRSTPSPTSTARPTTTSLPFVSTPTPAPPGRTPRPSGGTARRRLRRLARPPDQHRALPRPARQQPPDANGPWPTVLINEASFPGARQRPHERRLHLAAARPSRPATRPRVATADPPDQRFRDAASAPGRPDMHLTCAAIEKNRPFAHACAILAPRAYYWYHSLRCHEDRHCDSLPSARPTPTTARSGTPGARIRNTIAKMGTWP